MKCIIPEISWHNRDPVLSVDVQPRRGNSDDFWRLASGGTDAHVLIWYIKIKESGVASLEFAADLNRHQKAVNVVRFSPSGEFLASGDDESVILIWKQKTDQDLPELPTNDEEGNAKEQWISIKVLRGHVEDVYDLCWSPDSTCILSGSVDNSAIFWDVQKGRNTCILSDHKGFVQGVAWDPQNQFVATMSSDRLCRIYNINTKRAISRLYKSWLPGMGNSENPEEKVFRLYHDDTLKTFFRRLSFTPDGELLITPSGVIEQEGDLKNINVTYIYSRHLLNRPVVYLPTGDKYTIAVRCCPVLYELRGEEIGQKSRPPKEEAKKAKDIVSSDTKDETMEEIMEVDNSEKGKPEKSPSETPKRDPTIDEEKPWDRHSSLFALPYRIVFAVATQNSVILYDTQQPLPFAKISNIHYTRLTDIAWSSDGRILVASSTDGYCSVITFAEEELGIPYKPKDETQNDASSSPISIKNPVKEEKASEELPTVIKQSSISVKGKSEKTPPDSSVVKRKSRSKSQLRHSGKKPYNSEGSVDVKSKVDSGISPQENLINSTPKMSKSKPSVCDLDLRNNCESINNASPLKQTPEKNKAESPFHGNANKTPAQEQRKTPRRVQLITLSSPKSKKRLM